MDPKAVFKQAVEQASSCVKRVKPTDLSLPTPCSDWDLRALLNHMVYELLWMPDLLAGKTIAEVGDAYEGDVLKNNAPSAWRQAADKALSAVEQADLASTVHLSYGDRSAEYYIQEAAADMLIHGWDVGQALNCSMVFEQPLARAIYNYSLPKKDDMAESGLFGTLVTVSDSASDQAKLLALFGRHME